MLLTAKTFLYVTDNDGTSEMSLLAFSNAIKGGLRVEEIEITTTPNTARGSSGSDEPSRKCSMHRT